MTLTKVVITFPSGKHFVMLNRKRGGREIFAVLPKGFFGLTVTATFIVEPGDTERTLWQEVDKLHAIGL